MDNPSFNTLERQLVTLIQELLIATMRQQKGNEAKLNVIKLKMETILGKLNENGVGVRIKCNGKLYLLNIKSTKATRTMTTINKIISRKRF